MTTKPAFYKPFHLLSPKQRVHYIEWVDQHYRAFFVGDIPRPGPRPVFPDEANANQLYSWRSAQTAAYLGLHPQSLSKLTRRTRDPLPCIKDSRAGVHYCEADVIAWAKRNGYAAKNNA